MTEKTWQEIVEKAEQYKALGQTEHYLSAWRQDAAMPWDFATKVEPGGGHRLEVATDITVTAEHPSGMNFRWSVEMEDRDANGKGYYMFRRDYALKLLAILKGTAREGFVVYLTQFAEALDANADRFYKIAKDESSEAAVIRSAL